MKKLSKNQKTNMIVIMFLLPMILILIGVCVFSFPFDLTVATYLERWVYLNPLPLVLAAVYVFWAPLCTWLFMEVEGIE